MVSMTTKTPLIIPQWQAPKGVFAYCTTRLGGVSDSPFDSLNVGNHVGDESVRVRENRSRLPFASHIHWLNQTHSSDVIALPSEQHDGDASVSRDRQSFCAVMTADCVPVLLCDNDATVVAAVHAGWKGLANGIIARTIAAMAIDAECLHAWIGPAISGPCYEVDIGMAAKFTEFPDAVLAHTHAEKCYLDLPLIAKQQCEQAGIRQVTSSHLCTYQQSSLFFSHRRACHEGSPGTGRIVSVIGLSDADYSSL